MEVASTSQTTSPDLNDAPSRSMNNPDSQQPTPIDAPRTDIRNLKIVSGHSEVITHPQDQTTAPFTSNTSQEIASQRNSASNQSPSDSTSLADSPQTRLDVSKCQNIKLDVSLPMPFSLASIAHQQHNTDSSNMAVVDLPHALMLPSAIATRFPYLKSHFSNLLLQVDRHPPIASAPTSTTDRPITIYSKAHISRPITAEQPPYSSFAALFSQADLDAFPLDDDQLQISSSSFEMPSTTESSTSAAKEPRAAFGEGMIQHQADPEDRIELDHRTELEEQRKRRLEAFAEVDDREEEEEQQRKKRKRERKREKKKRSKQRKRVAATAAQTDAGAMQSEASTGSIEPMLVDASEVEDGESRDEVSSGPLIPSISTPCPLRPSPDVSPATHPESNHSNVPLPGSKATPNQVAIAQDDTVSDASMTAPIVPSPVSSRSPSPIAIQHSPLSRSVHDSTLDVNRIKIDPAGVERPDEKKDGVEDEDSALLTLEQEAELFGRSRSASVDHTSTSPPRLEEALKKVTQLAPFWPDRGLHEDVAHSAVADPSSFEKGQPGDPLSSDLSELDDTSVDFNDEGDVPRASTEGLKGTDASEGSQTVSNPDQPVSRTSLSDYLDQALAKEMKDIYAPWWEENASSSSLRTLLANRDGIFESQRGQNDDKKQVEAMKAITSPKGSIRDQTQRTYLSHFAEYLAFCHIIDIPAFPITAQLSVLFLYQHRIQWPKSSRKINVVALRTIARWTSDIFSDESNTTVVDWNSQKELIGILQECVSPKKGPKRAKVQTGKTGTTTQADLPSSSSTFKRPPRSNSIPSTSMPPASADDTLVPRSTIQAATAFSQVIRTTTPLASSEGRRLRSRLDSTKSTLSSSPSEVTDRNGVGRSGTKDRSLTSSQQTAACSSTSAAQKVLEEAYSSNAKSPVLSVPQPSSSLARMNSSASLHPPSIPSDIAKSLNPKSTATAQTQFAESSRFSTSRRQSMRAPLPSYTTSLSSLPGFSLSIDPTPRFELPQELVPQLLAFLTALDRSLTHLAPLLQAAGYRTLDSLVELASLESSTRNRMYQEIIARSDIVDGKLFELLELRLIEAKKGDWKD